MQGKSDGHFEEKGSATRDQRLAESWRITCAQHQQIWGGRQARHVQEVLPRPNILHFGVQNQAVSGWSRFCPVRLAFTALSMENEDPKSAWNWGSYENIGGAVMV